MTLTHGNRKVQAFVVYPEVNSKAPVVILIHEIFGLTDWAKEMATRLAAQGFIVIAPDLLRGWDREAESQRLHGPGRDDEGRLGTRPGRGDGRPGRGGRLRQKTARGQWQDRSCGLLLGRNKSFAFAAHRKDLSAAFVFYGSAPGDVSTITAPVYGFYGGNDERIDATVPATDGGDEGGGQAV